jgi:hypothetical protein
MAARSPGRTLAAGLSATSVNPVSRARPQRVASSSVALPRPNNVPNMDRRRNQPEPLEAVGDSLLLGENVVIERTERELRPVDRSALRRKIDAARLRENGRDLIAMLVSPSRRRRDGVIGRGDDVRMLGGEVAVDQKEGVLRADVAVERQRARVLLQSAIAKNGSQIDQASTAPRTKAAASGGAR